MEGDEVLRRSHDMLLIKPSDYDTFHLLTLNHIANFVGTRAPNSLAGTFLQAHGLKLWPTEKAAREHLESCPAPNVVLHWASTKARRESGAADGPIFHLDAFMTAKQRTRWRKRHHKETKDKPGVLKEHESSKLGRALQTLMETVFSNSPEIEVSASTLDEHALVERIVNGHSALPPNGLKPSNGHPSQTTPQADERLRDDDSAQDAIRKMLKRGVDASDTTQMSFLPVKKPKMSTRNGPPTGTFLIPQSLHRLETLPMKPPPSQRNNLPAHFASSGPNISVPEIPFNFMQLVPTMPYPHADEEARLKTLARYVEETGVMGGLPIAQ